MDQNSTLFRWQQSPNWGTDPTQFPSESLLPPTVPQKLTSSSENSCGSATAQNSWDSSGKEQRRRTRQTYHAAVCTRQCALAKGQTCTSVEQSWQSRNKPSHLRSIDFGQGCQDNSMGKEQSFQQIGQRGSHMQKNKVCTSRPPCTKINSKWITDLNGRAKTAKLLENREVTLWPRIRQRLLRLDAGRTSDKGNNRWTGHCWNAKLLRCGSHHQQADKTTHRTEVFANHVSDKGMVSKTYKELLKFNNKD